MRPRKRDLDLPVRMRRKGRSFYYRSRDGREIPLGRNLAEARLRWAELENQHLSADALFSSVRIRFAREVIPQKAPRTQKDYTRHLDILGKVFDSMPIGVITPAHVRRYLDLRQKQSLVQSNRERAVLSYLFNWARGVGILAGANPVTGVHGRKERGRSVYVDDAAYKAVWDASGPSLRDALDLARLTGQRPADVLAMSFRDIREGCLEIRQKKTGQPLRIEVVGELAAVIERIRARAAGEAVSSVFLVQEKGQRVSYWRLAHLFQDARKATGEMWQFRDLRAKAATERTEESGAREAQRLLGHSSVTMTEAYIRQRRGEKVKPLK